MKTFSTYGPVNRTEHYVVSREAALADFIRRVKQGRYIVIFAPRQTGKTTFFHWALESLTVGPSDSGDTGEDYFPIEVNCEVYAAYTAADFYPSFYKQICEEIERVFHARGTRIPETLHRLLTETQVADHVDLLRFFQKFGAFLGDERLIFMLDEFDGIPLDAGAGFLHTLRTIYVHRSMRKCPYSVGIVGVQNIAQRTADRTISPFNIQDEFEVPNFTLEEVLELFAQYTEAVGQPFASGVCEAVHKQTGGQPVLVNRFGQILTEEMGIPKSEPITQGHFATAHKRLLSERNTNIQHLVTNIRRDKRFETLLMQIAASDVGVPFNPYNERINELAMYGVIRTGADGFCEIVNPIYHYCILQAFK